MGAKGTTPIKRFGDWESKAKETVYQAVNDGFVVGHVENATAIVEVKSDGNNPPTTNRYRCQTNTHLNFCVPVKKLDYWKVVTTLTIDFIYWIPLLP